MKTSLVAIASAILLTCAPAFAQSAAPLPSADPAVVAATKQMLLSMNMRESLGMAMQQMARRMPEQIKTSAVAVINGNPNLNAQQKTDAIAKAEENAARIGAQIQSVLADPSLVDDMIAEMVPLYAETFTLDEIRQLTVFYTSPLGKKMIATMPALMSRSMDISNRIMMPRIQKAMAQSAQATATPAPGQ